jgi:hypothetical protein
VGCEDNAIHVLYDPKISQKASLLSHAAPIDDILRAITAQGALLCAGRAPRKKDITDFIEAP